MLALQVKYPDNYVHLDLDDDVDDIICYKKDPTTDDWKIALPESLLTDTVKRFYHVIAYPGNRRFCDTLSQHYHQPKLRYHLDRLKCRDWQQHKLAGHCYGLLPKRKVRITPWEEVTLDMVGPWNVKINADKLSSLN